MNLHIIPICLYLFAGGIFGMIIFGMAALASGLGGHRGASLLHGLFWVSAGAVVFSASAQITTWVHVS